MACCSLGEDAWMLHPSSISRGGKGVWTPCTKVSAPSVGRGSLILFRSRLFFCSPQFAPTSSYFLLLLLLFFSCSSPPCSIFFLLGSSSVPSLASLLSSLVLLPYSQFSSSPIVAGFPPAPSLYLPPAFFLPAPFVPAYPALPAGAWVCSIL